MDSDKQAFEEYLNTMEVQDLDEEYEDRFDESWHVFFCSCSLLLLYLAECCSSRLIVTRVKAMFVHATVVESIGRLLGFV